MSKVKIEINHDGELSNIVAIEAVKIAMTVGAWESKPIKQKQMVVIDPLTYQHKKVKVKETSTIEMIESGNSCSFDVTRPD